MKNKLLERKPIPFTPDSLISPRVEALFASDFYPGEEEA